VLASKLLRGLQQHWQFSHAAAAVMHHQNLLLLPHSHVLQVLLH
jgi:hypothetical protein